MWLSMAVGPIERPTKLEPILWRTEESLDIVEPEAAYETELSVREGQPDELEVSQRVWTYTHSLGKGFSKQIDNRAVYYEGRGISVSVLHNKMGVCMDRCFLCTCLHSAIGKARCKAGTS